MRKEEFLAMSLPYGVKAISVEVLDCIWTIHPYKDALDTLMDNEHLSYENFIKENSHKLILHPLTDLTKPIEHKGETFVPIKELNDLFGYDDCRLVLYRSDNNNIGWCINGGYCNTAISFKDMFDPIQKLIEWHFNLMDEGEEFIDVNTLDINPYK